MKSHITIFSLLTTALIACTVGHTREQTSITDFIDYREFCEQAVKNDHLFANFKSINNVYIGAVENVSKEQGEQFLKVIREESPELLKNKDLIQVNDLIGRSTTEEYDEIGAISPTTLRYIKIASDIKNLFGDSLNQKSIIEIGGGYGGQCLILSRLYQFKDYTIVDLPEPLALAKKYLEQHNIFNVLYKTPDEVFSERSYDLIISNYALNECAPEMQEKYLSQILQYSKRGYMTGCYSKGEGVANFGFKKTILNDLQNFGHICEEFSEKPITHPANVLLVWKPPLTISHSDSN